MKHFIKIIRDNAQFQSQPSAVAIGNFDGVHLGHQQLISKLVTAANGKLIPSIVTFEPPPLKVLAKNTPFSRIASFRLKMGLFAQLGIKQVLCLRFNRSLAALSAKTFIEHYLLKMMNAQLVMVGQDFEFGFNKQGNAGLLAQSAMNYDFTFESITLAQAKEDKVSSTVIRTALQSGDLISARKWLDRHYTLMGRVVRGQGLGRKWGIPTANLNVKANECLIRGIYITRVTVKDKQFFGATSIGVRPTVDGQRFVVETHLLNCDEDLYGQWMQLEILHKLRDEEKFENINDLKKQIFKDIEDTKKYIETNA